MARAAAQPEEPWLFYREANGWDWRWRSWLQVVEQVARGAELLRRQSPPGAVVWANASSPDAVTAELALRAASLVSIPLDDDTARRHLQSHLPAVASLELILPEERPRTNLPAVVLPAVSSRLDKKPLELPSFDDLDDDSVRGKGHASQVIDSPIGVAALFEDLRDVSLPKRPLLLSASGVGSPEGQTILAWGVATGAVWAMAAHRNEIVAAALWTRPTIVVASAADLGTLFAALQERRHRRWSRLAAVVEIGQSSGDGADWSQVGIKHLRLITAASDSDTLASR